MNKKNLYIDLIPHTSSFKNLRTILSSNEWDELRKKTYKKYNYKCAICNGVGKKHPVEAHERWDYDEDTQIQKLKNIVALCPKCHLVTHIGFAQIQNRFEEAVKHLKKVNNWGDIEVQKELERAFSLREKRNKIKWKINIDKIYEKGFE